MAVSITSANLVGSTLTVGGSGFGTKPTPSPIKFLSWDGLTPGAPAATVFDAIEFVNYTSPSTNFIVEGGQGPGGSNNLRMNLNLTTTGEWFPHHEFDLGSVDSFYMSYWMKAVDVTGNPLPSGAQLKFFRAGTSAGTPVDNYNSFFKFESSLRQWGTPDTANIDFWSIVENLIVFMTNDNGGEVAPLFDDGLWHLMEIEVTNNTPGSTDGLLKIWVDNVMILDGDGMSCRNDISQHFNFMQHNPGWAGSLTYNDWIGREARHYIDSSKCKTYLGNASTAAACTRKYLLPMSSHSSTGIVATDATNIPSGHDWVYVVDDTGTVNSSGYAYTGSVSTFQPVFAKNSNQLI